MVQFAVTLSIAFHVLLWWAVVAHAEEKTYFGTVIELNQQTKTLKLISHDGVMVEVKASGKASEHLDKIPLNSLIDLTVEIKGSSPPTIKAWKMAQAQSPCRIFDGSRCIP